MQWFDWAVEELDIQKAQNELRKMAWKVACSNKSITLLSVNGWLNLNTWMYCQAMTEEDFIKEEWEPAMLNILQAGVSQKKYTVLPWLWKIEIATFTWQVSSEKLLTPLYGVRLPRIKLSDFTSCQWWYAFKRSKLIHYQHFALVYIFERTVFSTFG